MNLKVKFVFSIGLLCLLCLMLSGSLRADTVYTYTGNPFTWCVDEYVPGCPSPLSISFNVRSGTSLDNLSWANMDPYLDSFTASGGLPITLQNASISVGISTDATGNITEWGISAIRFPAPGQYDLIESGSSSGPPPYASDAYQYLGERTSNTDTGDNGWNQNDPGTWTSAPTPEPSSILLLGTGLLVLLGLAARR